MIILATVWKRWWRSQLGEQLGCCLVAKVALAPGIKILHSQRDFLILQGNPKNYTYALMDIIWSREVLATHSLTGKTFNAHKDKTPKPSLDAPKVAALCGSSANFQKDPLGSFNRKLEIWYEFL
ncbi:uncharacterized protein LOC124456849 [Xenia sp. Carnegie-2017]|uniref:uncharacterized protein LOC124456849 n=1 Tax=Xenia sp. Carnegie-2017 TaxID=2897299 RepID=UPI001F049B3A|nr:uncharacterized protein LOC124456849 [Xenia sp. Carnegie-2017]